MLKCEFETITKFPQLEKLKIDCWKENGVDFNVDYENRRKILCEDFDRVVEVKICELTGQAMDEKLSKMADEFSSAQSECLSKIENVI